MEIVQEAVLERRYVPNASDMLLTTVTSGHIVGGAHLSLEDYDDACNCKKKNFAIGDISQRFFAYSSFGLTVAKRLTIVLVKGPDKGYWFAKVLLLFHERLRGNENTSGQFVFVQYFETT